MLARVPAGQSEPPGILETARLRVKYAILLRGATATRGRGWPRAMAEGQNVSQATRLQLPDPLVLASSYQLVKEPSRRCSFGISQTCPSKALAASRLKSMPKPGPAGGKR